MKRVLLSFLFCCLGFVALSQSTTVRIYAKSGTGSYVTGSATFDGLSYTRSDDNIVSGITSLGITSRGYAVFDLSALPPAASVSSVVTNFHVGTLTPGTATGWNTYGYPGDLSTVTSASTLYANMTTGTSLSTATYGTATGNQTLATTLAAQTFVQSNIGNKVSWCWTSLSSGTRTYYITGETGTATTAAGHAPYIDVTYSCTGVTGVAATATPNPVCPGNTFTLTATGSAGLTYTWQGPGSYAHTGSPATITATPSTPGVYTLTATASTGCRVVTTVNVTNATPPTITTPSGVNVCVGGTNALSASTVGGTWTTGVASIATVNAATGVVTGVAQGLGVITYTNSTSPFCWAVQTLNVNAVPAPIAPLNPRVCVGATTTLTNTSTGGTWTVLPIANATITAGPGNVGLLHGVGAGTATVTYNNTCGTQATTVITVDPLPAPISGPTSVCEWGAHITLASSTSGGTWTSSNATNATVDTFSGLVTGINDGTVVITYTSAAPQSCNTTYNLTINPAPNPITGVLKHCVGTPTTLSNSIPGGTWSSSTPPVATMISPGVFFGASGGYATISYTNACGTVTALDTVVATPPPFIGGNKVCQGGTLVLADSALGGTWSSSAPGIADVLPGSGVVSGISIGTAVITYTVPPGCSVTGTVTVIPGAPPITGGTQVCPGKTTALLNPSPGGNWSSGSPAVATVGAASGIVTGITPNTATISYTDTNGCVATVMVIVNPIPPAIIGDSILCPAVIDTFYNPAIGGTWSSVTPSLISIGATTGIAHTLNGGNSVIRYTFTGTGCYINKTVTIHVAPAPVVTYNTFTNTMEATPGFTGYQWYNNVYGIIPGATFNTTAAIVAGDYYVTVLDSNGCIGTSASVTYNPALANVNDNSASAGCRIYPNPANAVVYIDAVVKVNVVITDVAGRTELAAKGVNKIDINKLAPGLHIITVQDENGIKLAQQKLIKE